MGPLIEAVAAPRPPAERLVTGEGDPLWCEEQRRQPSTSSSGEASPRTAHDRSGQHSAAGGGGNAAAVKKRRIRWAPPAAAATGCLSGRLQSLCRTLRILGLAAATPRDHHSDLYSNSDLARQQ
jgi:hypothetical protein